VRIEDQPEQIGAGALGADDEDRVHRWW
jgi:hypothetical protein